VTASAAEVHRMRAIASVLTRLDVRVVWQPGWDDRGNGLAFDPRGLVEHWDASTVLSGEWGALGVIVAGRGGASPVPGPLSQFQRPRCLDGVPKVGIVAAGRANHAGIGGPYRLPDGTVIPQDSANRYMYGREAAWVGPSEERTPAAVHADGALAYAVREVLA
jgi:hypothetical protein